MLELILGPMFSGKTDELLRRVHGRGVLVKPRVDDRHAVPEIVSHTGARAPALVAAASGEIPGLVAGERLVGIDEGQFFDDGLAGAVAALVRGGARVVVAALDLDFRGEEFAVSAALRDRADMVDVLAAACGRCGRPATLTQRFVDGAPAPLGDAVLRVGGAELYEPRCRRCWAEERAAVRTAS